MPVTPLWDAPDNNALINIEFDQGAGASPISEQIAVALQAQGARVLALFRSWDTDGDGTITRAEFHKAMPALGLEVEQKYIDDLFDMWDLDGGGELEMKELFKILRTPPAKANAKPTARKLETSSSRAHSLAGAATVTSAAVALKKKKDNS